MDHKKILHLIRQHNSIPGIYGVDGEEKVSRYIPSIGKVGRTICATTKYRRGLEISLLNLEYVFTQ